MMNKTNKLMKALEVVKSQFFKAVAIVAITIGGMSSTSAAVCVQNATGSGQDTDPVIVTLPGTTCQGAGVVTAVTMDASIGNACMFGWYSYKVIVNGVTILTNQCDQMGLDLSAYIPITSVTIESVDGNLIPSAVNMALTLHVTYSANFCTGTPNAGVVAPSTTVACAGDTVGLTLSNQTSAIGLSYQWQSSCV